MKTLRSLLSLAAAAAALALSGCAPPGTEFTGRTDQNFANRALTGSNPDYLGIIMAVSQPDGKIIIGGTFDSVAGEPRTRLARLMADGSLDAGFNPVLAGPSPYVQVIAVQTDGKILVLCDRLDSVNGQPRGDLFRLHGDGTLDMAFDPVADLRYVRPERTDPGNVESLALQPDGRILIDGYFNRVHGELRDRLARLLPDGTLESTATFDPGAASGNCDSTSPSYGIALLPDGKFLHITCNVEGVRDYILIRRHPDGSRDETFGNDINYVTCFAVQPDGKILIANAGGIGRLLPDGAVEGTNTFYTGTGANGSAHTVTLQADGKILLGGYFDDVNGAPETGRIARLLPNGTVDPFLNTGADIDRGVLDLSLQADGAVLAAGLFTRVYGEPRSGLVRLRNGTAIQTLTMLDNGTRVVWARDGTAPEVSQVTMELSTDHGTSWSLLGRPVRVARTWQLTGVSLPPTGLLRARGRTSSGPSNGNSGLLEQMVEFPCDDTALDTAITSGPAGLTPVSTATFRFAANVPAQHFTYSLDGAAPVQMATASATLFVGPGPHTLSVFATGQSGLADPTPAVRAWTVDPAALRAGTGDPDFNHTTGAPPFVSGGAVQRLAVQPDGKILAAGSFSTVEGEPRRYLARFLPDGALEDTSTFDIGDGLLNYINALAVQPDGKIVIAGYFLEVNGSVRTRIARLLPNGSVESTATFNTGTGASSSIEAMVLQPDGKIIIAGDFTTFNGQPRERVARLSPDGTLDAGFIADVDGFVTAMALQPDGKVLIAGTFSNVDGQPRPGVARLLATGGVDPGFVPAIQPGSYPSALALQRDGHILVSGYLPRAVPGPPKGLVRLLPDGTEESAATFLPGTDVGDIYDMTLQADGRIVVAGRFETMRGQPRGGIAVLLPDGSLAPTDVFDTGSGARNGAGPGAVHAIALQADGNILLGGNFTSVAGRPFTQIARLVNHGAVSEFTLDAAGTAQWLVGNTAPAVDQVRFGMNTGTGWQDLGPGVRTLAGWKICGLLPPAAGTSLGAFGRASSKTGNGSLIAKTRLFGSARQRWREDTFGADAANPAIAGELADPDGDGVANLMEYAGGSHALNAASRPRMSGGVEGNNAVFIAERPLAATGITYGVEQSTDLTTWTPAAFTEEVLTDDGITRTVKVTVPMEINNPAKPEGFIRGKVSVIPPP